MAIGALSPYLNPAFMIRVYPPFLFSYLFAKVFFTLFVEIMFCNLDTKIRNNYKIYLLNNFFKNFKIKDKQIKLILQN